MNAYVAVLNYAIPVFISLLLIEALVARWMKVSVVRSMDTLASLSSGLTNAIKDVLGLTLVIISYSWIESKVGLFEIKSSWVVYLIAFIGIDFAGYWTHRLSHQVNYFWNHHIIHHSSEEFNLGCALRQTISAWFSLSFFFLLPTAILGVPPEVIAIVQPLHLFGQYWYHTRLIGKMGFLEKVIVTPSHHRVHHAINPEYMDRNISQIFIFWDKLFGTFQEELPNVPPVYGVKRPIRSWNPLIINFTHLWLLIQDAWRAKSWKDKFRIWFMPTGWRPKDVEAKFPVKSIEDVYSYQKYNPETSLILKWWSWFQFAVTFALMMYLFNNLSGLGFNDSILFGGFIVLMICSYTMLMDRNKYAFLIDTLKFLIAIAIILFRSDWFLIESVFTGARFVVICYFGLTWVLTYYFLNVSDKKRVAMEF